MEQCPGPLTADRMNPSALLAWVPSRHTVTSPLPSFRLSLMQHLFPSLAALKIWNYKFTGEFLKGPSRRKTSVTQNRKLQQSLKLSGDHSSQKPLHRGLVRPSTQEPSREKTEHARRGLRTCKKTTGATDCTSQQAAGVCASLRVTSSFRRGGAGLRARLRQLLDLGGERPWGR